MQRRALGAGPAGPAPYRRRLMLAAALALGCATAAVVTFLGDDEEPPAPASAGVEFVWPATPDESAIPTGTISLLPNPSTTSTSEPVAATSRAEAAASRGSREPGRARPSASRSAKPAAPALVTGSTVNLEVADRPGVRVRHRDFRGRLDPIGPTSSDLDRADARFTVRTGRANANCFSLESVNYPGYFLRHHDFEIRLDRPDRTELFDQDATFCSVTIRQGAALALRSVNYPDRHVAADGDRLVLRRSDADRATAFVPRSPL